MKQADTARAQHALLQPTLETRQKFVRDQLRDFLVRRGHAPTALELLSYAQSRFPSERLDVNTIRPRLTELHDRGLVVMGEKRRCYVSGVRVYTWHLAEPVQAGQPETQARFW